MKSGILSPLLLRVYLWFIDSNISFYYIMESCMKEKVLQYYSIANHTKEEANEEQSEDRQLVFVALKEDHHVSGNGKKELVTENSIQDQEVAPTFGSNIKIIALGDGRMFMTTTSEDENFDSIEPHLLTSDISEQDIGFEEEVLTENSQGTEAYEIVQVVDSSSPQMYQMIYCDVATRHKPNAKKDKSYICLYEGCGKMYSLPHHLNVHMRNHLDSKPYICTEDGCDKTFSTNYSLKAHIRTHTGEKPYRCAMCQKSFKTSGDLQKHIRIHTGEKPFICPIEGCGKAFTTSNIRKVHIRSHTGERPYTCDYPNCGKAFSSSTNYKNHIRIHSGEKPYICTVEECGKRFTEYSSLYKHNLVHQTDRPYMCIYCGQKFKKESAMQCHKRVKHSVIVTSDGTEIVVDLN